MKEDICRYCGEIKNKPHHCSGKKAYQKGWKDCELSIESKQKLMKNAQEHILEVTQEVDKIMEKL